MLGREVEDLLMGRIAQERAALHAAVSGLGEGRDVTPLGDEPADRKAPGGLERIDHPIIALHRGQLLHDVGQMGSPIRTGTGLTEMPHELSRRDHEGGQERARTMAEVCVLTLFRFAWLSRLGRGSSLEHVPAGLVVGAEDDAPLLGETERMDRALTHVVGRGVEVWIVALEPVHAPRRLEVCLLQETPKAGATHGLPPMLVESRDQIVETPPGGRTMICGRFPGRHRQHIHPLSGGKSAAGDPGAAHPAGPGGRASESADANGRRYAAHRPSRWPPAHAMGALARQSGG